MEPHFGSLGKSNWVIETVGDKSEYVMHLAEVIVTTSKNVSNVINEDYYMTFLTMLTE